MTALTPHHIALKVTDIKKCSAFYNEVLRLPVIRQQLNDDGVIRSVWLDMDGCLLMLETLDDPLGNHQHAPSAIHPGWHVLSLTITPDAREFWQKRLSSKGIQITAESDYSIYFTDPENNRLALSHYPRAVCKE